MPSSIELINFLENEMRIVNREEFLDLPAGTVFCKYAPIYFGDMEIKGTRSNYTNTVRDDYTTQLVMQTELIGDEFNDFMLKGESVGKTFKLHDGDCYGRDGGFDTEQLFAVFEKEDVENVIAKLTQALKTAY